LLHDSSNVDLPFNKKLPNIFNAQWRITYSVQQTLPAFDV